MRLGAALALFRTLGAHVTLHRPKSAHASLQRMRELAGVTERVVVVGGDGMVHLAANALADSSTVLGIIPAGTGNDAATSLGIPSEVEDACKHALRPATAIDLISNGTDVAVTVATAGFSVAVNDRADDIKRVKGAFKYTLASIVELRKLRSYSLVMTLDGVEHRIDASLVAVANTQHFGGGMKIAPDASVTNRRLDIVVIGPAPRRVFAAVLPLVFSGQHVRSKYVREFRATEVRLEGADLPLRADGERFGHLPVTLTVRPKALLVAGIDTP